MDTMVISWAAGRGKIATTAFQNSSKNHRKIAVKCQKNHHLVTNSHPALVLKSFNQVQHVFMPTKGQQLELRHYSFISDHLHVAFHVITLTSEGVELFLQTQTIFIIRRSIVHVIHVIFSNTASRSVTVSPDDGDLPELATLHYIGLVFLLLHTFFVCTCTS